MTIDRTLKEWQNLLLSGDDSVYAVDGITVPGILMSCSEIRPVDAHRLTGVVPLLTGRELIARTRHSYDAIARKYDDVWRDHVPRHLMDMFLSQLGRGSKVLDAGCGPGRHAALLERSSCRVTGIDASRSMLAIARRHGLRARFFHMDMCALKFAPASFDGIWCAASAIHVPRRQQGSLVAGFRRVLAPRGVLCLNVQVGRPSEIGIGHDERFFEVAASQTDVFNLIEQSGFEIEDWEHSVSLRNTHGAPILIRWLTVIARRQDGREAAHVDIMREGRHP